MWEHVGEPCLLVEQNREHAPLKDRLRQAREEAGLTMRQVADLVETEENTIWRHEHGYFAPSSGMLFKLARVYQKPVEWFSEAAAGFTPYELQEIDLVGVPIVGAISAGGLIEGWQSDFGTVGISSDWKRQAPRAFALKVTGNSLMADGIVEGDIVIVDPDAPFVDGKIYAVRSEAHNQTVTARHVYIMSRRRYKLVSGDGEIDEVERSRTEILGRIRWSMRDY